MRPHARSIVGSEAPYSSGPPPPPKPLPPLPPGSNPSPRRSVTAPSPPVKRKPLPANAFSPKTLSPSNESSKQDIAETGRSAVPASVATLHRVLSFETENHQRANNTYNPSIQRSPPQASLENFPVPPQPERLRAIRSDESLDNSAKEEVMALGPGERPPPLRTDSVNSTKTLSAKKQSPGSKFTSFFSRKPVTSPTPDSAATEFSEGRSPIPSPYPPSEQGSSNSAVNGYFFGSAKQPTSYPSQESLNADVAKSATSRDQNDMMSRYNLLEAELREISIELAGSIRRELDLEDLLERLQSESHASGVAADRTSDYFSDSGTSSLRAPGSELSTKEEIDRIKRDAEQQKATLRVDLSQKWQDEASQRKALQSHVHILEDQLTTTRQNDTSTRDAVSRIKELEAALEDAKRRLNEERQVKENFEDLLTALRVELEQSRGEPGFKLQQELQSLRDENAALKSAREMERGLQRGSIAEEGEYSFGPRFGGLGRSNTVQGGRGSRSLSRSNSLSGRPETIENAVEKMKAFEAQRDALHTTVKYLLRRQEQQQRQFDKRVRVLQAEFESSTNVNGPKKGGYEREVRVLRAEINTLRKRADDALEQKWQCEKGLAGLAIDLNRNKQETASLQRLLQARDSDPDSQELASTTLEHAIIELQKERARVQESSSKIQYEERLADELEESAARSEALAAQVKKQMQNNQTLRARLKAAVENGERDQSMSTGQINELQAKLRSLEDGISAAQTQSETAVMKHEEEVRVLKASHNAQLMRAKNGNRSSSNLLAQQGTPMSPMFSNSKRSPRLDKTSSGPGVPLHEALRVEFLENKVTDLEKALADTENEMGEVIGRMNIAQMSVAELEAERDHALRQTRKLEAAVREEQQRYKSLMSSVH